MKLPKAIRDITLLNLTNMEKILIMIIFMILTNNAIGNCQSPEEENHYAFKAMNKAVADYFLQKSVHKDPHMVIKMKIMKINKTSGVFVLRYILNDGEYEPSLDHYVLIENKVILVKADEKFKSSLESYGFKKITANLKMRIYEILAGPKGDNPEGPHLSFTGQPAPMMVFRYRREKIKGVIYNQRTLPKRKYWF